MPIAVVADAVRRRPLPILRLGAYGIVYLSAEIFAIVSASVLWVASGCGLAVKSAWSQRLHSAAQARWVAWLVAAAGRVLGLRISIAGADLMPPGPVIVLCRHTSLIDTLIPATLAAERGMRVRYVLKSDLLWDPALDLFGHRLPNHFVDRSGSNTAAELRALNRNQIPMHFAGVAVVGFFVSLAGREVKKTGDFFIEQDILHRLQNVRVESQ